MGGGQKEEGIEDPTPEGGILTLDLYDGFVSIIR